MDKTIRINVTRDRFDAVFSIDDSFHMGELTDGEQYHYLCQFVVNENGEYLDEAEARKLFKGVSRSDLRQWFADFHRAINDAFVNPTSGGS